MYNADMLYTLAQQRVAELHVEADELRTLAVARRDSSEHEHPILERIAEVINSIIHPPRPGGRHMGA